MTSFSPCRSTASRSNQEPTRTPTSAGWRGGRIPSYLFVYGTLRTGRAPPHLAWLDPLPRRAAWVPGGLLDLGAYPGFTPAAPPTARVVGELLALDPARLPELDRYEGFEPEHPQTSLFVREPTEAHEAGGARRKCWIYRYKGPATGVPRVPGGDWLAARPCG